MDPLNYLNSTFATPNGFTWRKYDKEYIASKGRVVLTIKDRNQLGSYEWSVRDDKDFVWDTTHRLHHAAIRISSAFHSMDIIKKAREEVEFKWGWRRYPAAFLVNKGNINTYVHYVIDHYIFIPDKGETVIAPRHEAVSELIKLISPPKKLE